MAAKFVLENQHKRSIADDAGRLAQLMPFIGQVRLDRLHGGTLEPWVEQQRKDGVTVGTINHGLKVVRRILNLAATEWMDDYGLTWLHAAPKIKLIPDRNKRRPYPLSVFIIPDRRVKNGGDRLVVLNKVALSVIDGQRRKHPEFVFVYRGKPIDRMLSSGWRQARKRAGLPQVRVHDLKHTFGRRLRAAG